MKAYRAEKCRLQGRFRGCRSEACIVMPVQLKAVLNQHILDNIQFLKTPSCRSLSVDSTWGHPSSLRQPILATTSSTTFQIQAQFLTPKIPLSNEQSFLDISRQLTPFVKFPSWLLWILSSHRRRLLIAGS